MTEETAKAMEATKDTLRFLFMLSIASLVVNREITEYIYYSIRRKGVEGKAQSKFKYKDVKLACEKQH